MNEITINNRHKTVTSSKPLLNFSSPTRVTALMTKIVKNVAFFSFLGYLIFSPKYSEARSCKLPPILDLSNTGIYRTDLLARKAAQRTCYTTYNKCLLYFAKISEQNYHAVCGNGIKLKE